jgi:hypothetical protein
MASRGAGRGCLASRRKGDGKALAMRTLTGLLLAIALGTEGLAAEPRPMACASSEEAGAITIRAMQARLMVSAISCGGEAS